MSDDESDSGEPRYEVTFTDDSTPQRYLSRDGDAVARFPNGDTYVGSYQHGKRHGRGVYTFASGAKYDGEYVDGVREGVGSFLTLDGSRYEGQWKADKKEGQGTYTYANGDVYRGAWKNDRKHGAGEYFYAKGGASLVGQWSNGFVMHGEMRAADGSKYVGAWHKNQPSGAGLHKFANGNQETGRYVIDRKLGYRWTHDAPPALSATTAGTAAAAAASPDPLRVAQRFLDKCVLKVDHFEGIGRLFKLVDGVPNLRKVADAPVFACGQPTRAALQSFVEWAGEQHGVDRFVWVNLRAEPVVYVKDSSFVPRSRHALNAPLALAPLRDLVEGRVSPDAPLLSAEQLATLETSLVQKVTRDLAHRGNLHVFVKDTFAELASERRALELQEEVAPEEDEETGRPSFERLVRSVGAVFATAAEEDGLDIEYRRLPLPSERCPSASQFDALVAVVKAAEPGVGLVFNGQMGRGRATLASIVATLIRRAQDALSTADERAESGSGPVGRTDLEGVEPVEFDEADPNYKLGQYALIMRLVRALPGGGGEQVKAELDDAVERCKGMQHAREAILLAREQMDKDVAALTADGHSPESEEVQQRRAFWLRSAQLLLERYAYLLLFHAYVKANVESEFEQQSFAAFLDANPQLTDIVSPQAISEFRWQ